jgi:hypothetical protein
MFVFFVYRKIVLLKVVDTLKIYQDVSCHGPTLSGASFASPQKIERQPFWNG